MAGKKAIPIPTIHRGINRIEIPHYVENDYAWVDGRRKPIRWLDATPVYVGWLHVVGYRKGRSSSCYEVEIVVGSEDEDMTVSGLMTCLQFLPWIARIENSPYGPHGATRCYSGVHNKWTVRKRGQNYLIEAAE